MGIRYRRYLLNTPFHIFLRSSKYMIFDNYRRLPKHGCCVVSVLDLPGKKETREGIPHNVTKKSFNAVNPFLICLLQISSKRLWNHLSEQAVINLGAGLVQWWERSPLINAALVPFWPAVLCGLSLLLVLALLRGFFSGSSVFLSPKRPTLPNSTSIRPGDPHENQLKLCCFLS